VQFSTKKSKGENMNRKINGAEYPLAKIFSSDFDFVIPSYQRPYAWKSEQVEELFSDLYEFYKDEQEEGYFLGSIVLIKDESKPYAEVIDGQQRLTTLTILMGAITNQLSGELKTDFEDYIRERGKPSQDLKPKPRLALRDRDREFFAKYVQGLRLKELLEEDPASLDNEAQRNIQSNSKLVLEKLTKFFSSDEKLLCKFGSFLVQRCFLVVVSAPTQNSAFRIFSVMNSRGLDLLPTDIIKADIIGKLEKNKQDEYTKRWEEMEVNTTRDGLNELFSHIRMIYANEKAKRSSLEEFREHVMKKNTSSEELIDPEEFIDKVLEPYADAFIVMKKEQYVSTKNSKDVNVLLKWLNRVDNSDWRPSAILFLSQKKNEYLYVLWFFQKLERLTAYLHICAKTVNYRIKRYGQVIAELKKEHSFDQKISTIELTEIEVSEMQNVLDSNIYELSPRRRNYLILRLDSFLSDGAATYDPNILTIEHVLPQNVPLESVWLEAWPSESHRQWVHRISNLVPLTQKRNSQAQNFDFEKKKNAYFGGNKNISSYALTTQVLNTLEWTPDTVEKRQQLLLQLLAERWELGVIHEKNESA
jgi:uncharacterized protein with ParB-like and HNH nuclease domain